jgi:protein-tyrosine phosphatase
LVKPGPAPAATTLPPIDEPRILLLCTANQCRSPMAEGVLRALAAQRGIPATVDSAGLLTGGAPATEHAVLVLHELGIDLEDHRSRSLEDRSVDLDGADLVLTMERRHVREAVAACPPLRDRAFTLIDAVRRAEAAPPRQPEETVRAWAARLAEGRKAADAQGGGDDEVGDPVGSGVERYRDTLAELRDLLGRLADRCWPATAVQERSA